MAKVESAKQKSSPRSSAAVRTERILIGSRYELDRRAIAALLSTEPDFKVVGEAGTGSETVDLGLEQEHDILVLDVGMTDPPGESCLHEVRRRLPESRILALAPHGREECLLLNPAGQWNNVRDHGHVCCGVSDCSTVALIEGALGVIYRDAPVGEFLDAVRAVAGGAPWLGGSSRWEDILAMMGDRRTDPVERLTAREKEIASLVGNGLSNKEIASRLGISEPTVKKHVGRVLHKLGIQDRLQLGICVVRHPLFFGRAIASSETDLEQ